MSDKEMNEHCPLLKSIKEKIIIMFNYVYIHIHIYIYIYIYIYILRMYILCVYVSYGIPLNLIRFNPFKHMQHADAQKRRKKKSRKRHLQLFRKHSTLQNILIN